MSPLRIITKDESGASLMARVRTHPGSVLNQELKARGLNANRLALAIRVPSNRITAIVRGERSITAETALRLGRYLGTGAEFWMNLQSKYDISVIESSKGALIQEEVRVAVTKPDSGKILHTPTTLLEN